MDLRNTQVADLAPLKGLTGLHLINLSDTKVTDLAPLQDLPKLETIIGAPDVELEKLNAYRAQKGLPAVKAL